jgi:serine acetyltransferase
MFPILKVNYINCITFAASGEASELRTYWQKEILRGKKFSWRRILTHKYNRRRAFLFWWRLANEMYLNGSRSQKKTAKKINRLLKEKYTTDIALGARIGAGLHIPHHTGVVITDKAIIGEMLTIRQNTTLGCRKDTYDTGNLVIGNNVDIGANSCIIGDITIGDNVNIGAMSFVMQDIPSNGTYITRKHSEFRSNSQ